MSTLKFNTRGDLVQPEYPCGKADKAISIYEHGISWCTWKLQDMSEKHMEKCKDCKKSLLAKEDDEVLAYFIKLGEETREAKDAFYQLQQAAFATAIALLGKELGATPVEEVEVDA